MFETSVAIETEIGKQISQLNRSEKTQLLKGLKYLTAKKEALRLAVKPSKMTMQEIVQVVKKIRTSNARA